VKHPGAPVRRYRNFGAQWPSMDAHLELARTRARERQRRYRLRRRRIDYFPDPHAATTIDSLRTRCAGGDAS
jgi:hypothetical protein